MKTFYWYFRPIAVILKIFGVFPIENVTSLDTSRLQFRVFSCSFLYSLIIFCVFVFMIYFFSGFMFAITVTEQYRAYVACVMGARSIISFLFCYRKYRELPRLIRLLDTFDKKKDHILITSITKRSMFYRYLFTNSVVIMGLTFTSYQSSELIRRILPPNVRETDIASTASIIFAFLTTWQLYPSFLYVYFAVKIIYSFREINNTLRERNFTHDYFNTGPTKYDSDMYQTLGNIRILHNMVSDSVYELGKCYGSYLAIDHLCIIIIFVLNISVFIYKSDHDLNILFLTLGNAIILVNTIFTSEMLKDSGSEVINLLHGIPSTSIPENCQTEIHMFLTQLVARPVQVSAAGYFILDKSHTLSIISAVATYLIVVVQYVQTPAGPCNSMSLK